MENKFKYFKYEMKVWDENINIYRFRYINIYNVNIIYNIDLDKIRYLYL